ncbi:MAG: class I SAM-dependent methyltransferase [Oscillospiraceae bacterium]|nr:class I SAM-dependent methyltransferase [Oscillospiraceae bacterium]
MKYTQQNAQIIDSWQTKYGLPWMEPISHERYLDACRGDWDITLTPVRPVPHHWIGDVRGKKVLGLAAGGGQQMPVLCALGAECTVLDISRTQLESEEAVARREGYAIQLIRGDMTEPLPFPDESFDMIINPVSNHYIEEVLPVFAECHRVLKKGGQLLCGLDTGIYWMLDSREERVVHTLPFNPLKDRAIYEELMENDMGLLFSHTLEEQIGGQLKAGFRLLDLYEDTNGAGPLHEKNVPTFIATRCRKEDV